MLNNIAVMNAVEKTFKYGSPLLGLRKTSKKTRKF